MTSDNEMRVVWTALLLAAGTAILWGKEAQMPKEKTTMSDEELQKKLTPEQFKVVRKNGTEPPFHNAYWDNHAPGIYVDVVSGEPLFSSTDKFDSGTGWPSFTAPIEKDNVVTKTDKTLWMVRNEVRSKGADSHLGHVFDDGPAPTGLRYCINSAALRFIPADKLEAEGYGAYRRLFGKAKGPVATQKAAFAAGCFWGVQSAFDDVKGVVKTTVGYTGGHTKDPTYEKVCSHTTGHAEAVEVEFDPTVVSYDKLVEHFFKIHNPTTRNRQGPDVGDQYRSAIFYYSPEQKKEAEALTAKLDKAGTFKSPIVTEIAPATTFYPAEDYHQKYNEKNGLKSCHIY